MILMLELIMLIVYGLFVFVIIKSAERTNKNLKERNIHLLKRCKAVTEQNDRLHYDNATLSSEIDAKDERIELLEEEIKMHKLNAKDSALQIRILKEENVELSFKLQKMECDDGTECHPEV